MSKKRLVGQQQGSMVEAKVVDIDAYREKYRQVREKSPRRRVAKVQSPTSAYREEYSQVRGKSPRNRVARVQSPRRRVAKEYQPLKSVTTKTHGTTQRLRAGEYYRQHGPSSVGDICDIRNNGELKCLQLDKNGRPRWTKPKKDGTGQDECGNWEENCRFKF